LTDGLFKNDLVPFNSLLEPTAIAFVVLPVLLISHIFLLAALFASFSLLVSAFSLSISSRTICFCFIFKFLTFCFFLYNLDLSDNLSCVSSNLVCLIICVDTCSLLDILNFFLNLIRETSR